MILGDVAEPAALVLNRFRERQWTRLHLQMNDDAALTQFVERISKLVAGSASSSKNASKLSPTLVIAPPCKVNSKRCHALYSCSTTALPSIAALALANRSASADDEYFSDGRADELLNVLSKIKGLHVVARTSSFAQRSCRNRQCRKAPQCRSPLTMRQGGTLIMPFYGLNAPMRSVIPGWRF